jgi:hypothetical protein
MARKKLPGCGSFFRAIRQYNYGIEGTIHKWFQNYSKILLLWVMLVMNSNPSGVVYDLGLSEVLRSFGPLPFLLLLNEIRRATKQNNINLFADDANLVVFGSNAVELSNAPA